MITTPITIDLLRGALELEPTGRGVLPHRLPAWARTQYDDGQMTMVESQPSGVRLVFSTRASVVELDTLPTKRAYTGAPPRPDGVYDVLVDGQLFTQLTAAGGDVITIDLTTGATETRQGEPQTLHVAGLSAAAKTVEIWLPHDETTELVALRTDAPIEPVPTSRRVWLHHGSSISHGSNATHPTGTWPALAAAQAGVELVNLGFGGSAFLQPFIARTIRDTPADLISVKLGINIVNTDGLRLRSFTPAVHGFLDTIRDGHPDTPLLVVSPILCPIHEDTPGPTGWDLSALAAGELRFVATGNPDEIPAGKLTLSIIRAELARITAQRAASDPNLHYLDGLTLYGEADNAAHPLADGLHPGAETHESMAARFTEQAFKGAFSA
ncbi:GDSL-like lipase/acylhydrolase family protein [Kribbella rubisoli]|uniref:GDSL-like lipase/acylhydrolase family protein n=1 Tax=Kribbella rubisoli TaxID=3075929 RepID=A0A4Q7WKF5_9ACTN|nr:GDSL-type esterase/lipase family protein [Kribbella rubisoli]RZU10547.1 GDSL-like lipase/acylhydrolase family protein [Kribbella rubisoli]